MILGTSFFVQGCLQRSLGIDTTIAATKKIRIRQSLRIINQEFFPQAWEAATQPSLFPQLGSLRRMETQSRVPSPAAPSMSNWRLTTASVPGRTATITPY